MKGKRWIDRWMCPTVAHSQRWPHSRRLAPHTRRTESGKHGRESISHKIQHLGISHSRICASPRGSQIDSSYSWRAYLWYVLYLRRGRTQSLPLLLSLSFSGGGVYWPITWSIDIRFPEHLKRLFFFLRGLKAMALYCWMEETWMTMNIQRRGYTISSDRITTGYTRELLCHYNTLPCFARFYILLSKKLQSLFSLVFLNSDIS